MNTTVARHVQDNAKPLLHPNNYNPVKKRLEAAYQK